MTTPRSPSPLTDAPSPASRTVGDRPLDPPARPAPSTRGAGRWPSTGVGFLLLGLVPLLMLAGAVLVQVIGHEEPCPLCVLQRYACLVAAAGLWLAAVPGRFRPAGAGVGLVGLIAGGVVAAHHSIVVWHPIVSCGIDTLQPLVNGLPTAGLAPLLFEASGMCTNPAPLLGLPLPAWSLLGFTFGAVLTLAWLRRTRQERASVQRPVGCDRCS